MLEGEGTVSYDGENDAMMELGQTPIIWHV
jgi:hypothetical protein